MGSQENMHNRDQSKRKRKKGLRQFSNSHLNKRDEQLLNCWMFTCNFLSKILPYFTSLVGSVRSPYYDTHRKFNSQSTQPTTTLLITRPTQPIHLLNRGSLLVAVWGSSVQVDFVYWLGFFFKENNMFLHSPTTNFLRFVVFVLRGLYNYICAGSIYTRGVVIGKGKISCRYLIFQSNHI